MTDEFHFEIKRKHGAFDPPPPLFVCVECNKEIKEPERWEHISRGRPLEREPLCKICTSRWGSKHSGPVFNRQNFHTLKQLSAIVNLLEWEIKNGQRRYR